MPVEVIVALITALGGVGTAVFARQRKRLGQAENEMKFKAAALSFDEFLTGWNEVQHEVLALMEETEIDRFLLLRAWNGSAEPKWTTAFYQLRLGDQKPYSYVHFELDRDYVERIRNVVINGSAQLRVANEPDSAIKRVYEMEGVRSGLWFFIARDNLQDSAGKDTGSAAITYASFCSHSDDEISRDTEARCRILVGRIKGMVRSFN